MFSREINNGVGLVLSGGGGKGAYEIGVWQALDEYGVTPNISAVSGTSVGALNAALFAQGSLDSALQVWETISPEAVMTLNKTSAYQNFVSSTSDLFDGTRFSGVPQSIHRWIIKRYADQGILSKEGLSHLIDETIEPGQIHLWEGPIYVAAYNTSSLSLQYFNLKINSSLAEIKERLLASASIPVIFGKTYIDGKLYWDGGIPIVGDNTPVKPLYDDGYRTLIVVHLSREEPVDHSKYPGCNIIEIMPQEDLGGIVSGTMNFKPEIARMNVQRGFDDAVQVLEPLFKTGLALNRMHRSFQAASNEQKLFSKQDHLLNEKLHCAGKEIDSLLSDLDKGGLI